MNAIVGLITNNRSAETDPAGRVVARWVVVVLLGSFVGGCGTNVTMNSWQHDLERYVREDGQGDPAVLRDLKIDPNRPGFTQVGNEDPRHGTDAKGLLLGHKVVNGQPWFFYLVGLVKDQKVDEIRLAALSVRPTGDVWSLSPKSPEALHMYRNYNEGLGKQRFPGHKQAPTDYSGFPRDEDDFDLSLDGNHVTAVHKQSGAWWELNLPS